MTISSEVVAVIISALALIGGLFAWWFAKVLSERKEDITQSMTIKYMGERILELGREVHSLKEKCDRIGIMEEQIRQLSHKN